MIYDDARMAKYPQVSALFDEAFTGLTERQITEIRLKLRDITGVAESSVGRWIAGESRPGRDYWPALESVTGVPVERWRDAHDNSDAVIRDAIADMLRTVGALVDRVDALEARLGQLEAASPDVARGRPRRG